MPYPFSTGDLISCRNTYFYTEYQGMGFIDAWKHHRNNVKKGLPLPSSPPKVTPVEPGSNNTHDLLERALGGDKVLTEKFLRKFEITKRIHDAYDLNFRAIDPTACHSLHLYVRTADLFELTYTADSSVRYLNGYMKCLDTLCAHVKELDEGLKARLVWHLDQELIHVQRKAHELGITI